MLTRHPSRTLTGLLGWLSPRFIGSNMPWIVKVYQNFLFSIIDKQGI
jgi:hypothetical protein